MKFRKLLLFSITFLTLSVFAVEDIQVSFNYAGNHGVDFSGMRYTLRIAEFTDGRNLENARLITDNDMGNSSTNGGYQAEEALSVIIRQALIQGFESGGAKLVEADADMRLEGNLLASDYQLVERDGIESIQLTLRTSIQLRRGGRTIWQTTLFGRGVTPSVDGLAAAVHAALERTIRELVMDDYFLLEIL
ncbi:MAG: hypothetical protein IIC60_04035 [Proteobacteria bacterium]|nr:hypothetical protein [Pseudomonadota bacterium]